MKKIYMSLRQTLKKIRLIRLLYYYFLFVKNSLISNLFRLKMLLVAPEDVRMLKELRPKVKNLYPLDLDLANEIKFYAGKNILGYPAMGFIKKNGELLGWEEGKIILEGESLQLIQLKTDLETNFISLFKRYQPQIIVDYGTAAGGTAVYFYNLASKYCQPKVLSIDITEDNFRDFTGFHEKNQTKKKVEFVFGKSTLDCLPEVTAFLNKRQPGQRVLLSFDDDHHYSHTHKELEIYAPLLMSGDVILMQDTWNQDLYGHEVSPMLSVHRFLKEYPEFALDEDFCKQVSLPCNFIHGVIVKK